MMRQRWRSRVAASLLLALLIPVSTGGQSQTCWWDQDFDGDEAITFDDFFLFAEHMGRTPDISEWNPVFDVVEDDRIDFDDFFKFADWWPRGVTYEMGVCDGRTDTTTALHLALDGDGDHVVVTRDSGLFGNDEQTVAVRFRLDRFSQGNTFGWSQILSNDEYELAVRSSDQRLVACCYNAPSTLSGTQRIELARWYDVAFIRDGDQQRLYIDGELVASGSAFITEPALDLWIGNDPSPPTRPFAGAIDDVQIWRRVLADEEIAARLSGEAVSETDLAGSWDFDGTVTGLIRDRGPWGRHGRVVGDAHQVPEGTGPLLPPDPLPDPPAPDPDPPTPLPSGTPLLTTSTDGDLVFKLLSTNGAAFAELGLGTPGTGTATSERDVIFPGDSAPGKVANMGFYPAGSELHFYQFTRYGGKSYWAFSAHLGEDASESDRVAFLDTDGSRDGSIIDSLGVDHWVLHLDDAASICCDDDDNELVVDVQVVPVDAAGSD